MKKAIRIFIGAVMIFSVFAGVLQAQEKAQKKTSVKEIKLLTIGNSFSASLKRYFEETVSSVPGCRVELEQLTIGGCSLERHWKNVEKEEMSPGTKAYFNCTYKEKLQSKKWDVVTLQQASHYSWQPETFEPFAANLCKFIRENAPSAEIILQQTWSYRHDDPRLKKWNIDQTTMYEKLKDAYNKAAKELNLRVIPVGFAVQLARENQPGGYGPYDAAQYKYPNLPDINRFFTGQFKWSKDQKKIEGDRFHLNSRGQYLQACVWFAFLFDRNALEVTFVPKELTEKDAKFIREMAQKAVTEFKQVHSK